ncbi:cytochrome C biogenesis protein [Candidatus Woesearchaeota archaeon]|nr:cytochrome C biogenesis protein [Candidatus Woesearchaeota archaeon]
MIDYALNLWLTFLAGIVAPLGAVCVWPLYPGFLAYLSNQLSGKESKKTYALLGFIATLGVITSLGIIGLIVTTLFRASLTNAIGIISPIAFIILGIVGILLIFNVDFGRFLPQTKAPILKNPLASAYVFGLFFGAIVLPCNPGPIIALFALSTGVTNAAANFSLFLVFGLGMGLPLLLFSIISAGRSQQIINWMSRRKTIINRSLGIVIVLITLYFLIFDFKVFG